MTKLEEQGIRLEQLLSLLKIDQTDLARLSGRSPSLINQIIKGKKKISNAVLTGLTIGYSGVNVAWLLNGVGEPLVMDAGEKSTVENSVLLTINGEPSAELVGKLYDDVIGRFSPFLTAKQDLALRQACYRCLVDNPGQPWPSLLVGAGVYLRFIEAYPNLAIPDPASGNTSGSTDR